MIGRLRRTTAIAAVMLPVGGVIFHLSGLDPMSAALVSASVVLTQSGTNAMNHLSKAWRAGQALKGNWNVLTAKPEKQKVESRIESFNAVPQASPG